MIEFIKIAAEAAVKKNDGRTFRIGGIAIRSDNVIVSASNGLSFSTKYGSFLKDIRSHCEGRLIRKCDHKSRIFLARVKKDGSFGLAKPCEYCSVLLKTKEVLRVIYTIDNDTFGIWIPKTNKNSIHKIKNETCLY